ncbi:MAG TPA: hypothetical protein DCL65_08210, partial [Chryseobacterium sp.]|nr:hypothetical protein [Chryseobacterium sp.]
LLLRLGKTKTVDLKIAVRFSFIFKESTVVKESVAKTFIETSFERDSSDVFASGFSAFLQLKKAKNVKKRTAEIFFILKINYFKIKNCSILSSFFVQFIVL